MERDSLFNPHACGPAAAELLLPARECPLGPGQPNRAAGGKLRALTVEMLFGSQRVIDHGMAQACLAGLWLYHDFLDESHAASQEIESPSGSYWHGILHRREPDYDNAKYWFRRVGQHPVFPQLATEAKQILQRYPEAELRIGRWDPFAFVHFCERNLVRPLHE